MTGRRLLEVMGAYPDLFTSAEKSEMLLAMTALRRRRSRERRIRTFQEVTR